MAWPRLKGWWTTAAGELGAECETEMGSAREADLQGDGGLADMLVANTLQEAAHDPVDLGRGSVHDLCPPLVEDGHLTGLEEDLHRHVPISLG